MTLTVTTIAANPTLSRIIPVDIEEVAVARVGE